MAGQGKTSTEQSALGRVRLSPPQGPDARVRDPLRQARYELPTSVVYGARALERLPELLTEAGVENPLLVTDKGLTATDIPDRVRAVLTDSQMTHELFAEVEPDPSTVLVERIGDILRERGHDGVIGLGGGSAMDAAKAAAAVATSGLRALELVGPENVPCDPLPIVAIPTTAGTGSEVTKFSVLTDLESGAKASIASMRIMPRYALLDPELTVGLPAALTASTGLDALSHAIESFGSVWNNPISEGMALHAVSLAGKHLRTATHEPDDLEGRAGMLAASCIAELAANTTRLGLAHALAVPLGATHHIPHGVAVAMMLPPMAAYNEAVEADRYRVLAKALDPCADTLSEGLASLYADVGVSARLRDFGVAADDYERVIGMAMRSDNVLANPRPVEPVHLRQLLEQAQ